MQSVLSTLLCYYSTDLIASSNDLVAQKSPRLALAVGIYFIARCKHSYTCEGVCAESKKISLEEHAAGLQLFRSADFIKTLFFCEANLLQLSGNENGEKSQELEDEYEGQKQIRENWKRALEESKL